MYLRFTVCLISGFPPHVRAAGFAPHVVASIKICNESNKLIVTHFENNIFEFFFQLILISFDEKSQNIEKHIITLCSLEIWKMKQRKSPEVKGAQQDKSVRASSLYYGNYVPQLCLYSICD